MVLVNSCTPTYINYSVESDMSCDQNKLEKTAMKPPQEIVPQEAQKLLTNNRSCCPPAFLELCVWEFNTSLSSCL